MGEVVAFKRKPKERRYNVRLEIVAMDVPGKNEGEALANAVCMMQEGTVLVDIKGADIVLSEEGKA